MRHISGIAWDGAQEVHHSKGLQIMRTVTSARAVPLSDTQRRSVEAFIDQRIGDKIRVLDLASLADLCASQFSRAFRISYGCSPYSYLLGRRMALACHLLETSEQPLSQIAIICGLADQAHFNNVFRKRLGKTPLEWQRSNRSGMQSGGGSSSPRA